MLLVGWQVRCRLLSRAVWTASLARWNFSFTNDLSGRFLPAGVPCLFASRFRRPVGVVEAIKPSFSCFAGFRALNPPVCWPSILRPPVTLNSKVGGVLPPVLIASLVGLSQNRVKAGKFAMPVGWSEVHEQRMSSYCKFIRLLQVNSGDTGMLGFREPERLYSVPQGPLGEGEGWEPAGRGG